MDVTLRDAHQCLWVAPLDGNVMDRILATPAAKRFAQRGPLAPMVPEMRRRFGGRLSDEEVLLRIMFPEEHVEALLAAPGLDAAPRGSGTALLDLARGVLAGRRSGSVSIQANGTVSARFP